MCPRPGRAGRLPEERDVAGAVVHLLLEHVVASRTDQEPRLRVGRRTAGSFVAAERIADTRRRLTVARRDLHARPFDALFTVSNADGTDLHVCEKHLDLSPLN